MNVLTYAPFWRGTQRAGPRGLGGQGDEIRLTGKVFDVINDHGVRDIGDDEKN